MLIRSAIQQKAKGFSLIEALVSVAVLSFGLLAIGSFQAKLVAASGYNKARFEGLALAKDKIDEIRSYTTEHGLVENLLNTGHSNPDYALNSTCENAAADLTGRDANSEYCYPQDVPLGPSEYSDTIDGVNASYTRVWEIVRDVTTPTDDEDSRASHLLVKVRWTDRNGRQQVSLESDVTWRNPRGSADVEELAQPLVYAPTGKAFLGDGSLSETEMNDLKTNHPEKDNNDGTFTHDFDNDGDLELVVEQSDGTGEVVLTLPDACQVDGGCSDFVKISGTVFFHRATGGGTSLSKKTDEVWVIASDAAYCSRWVPVSATATELTTSTKIVADNTSYMAKSGGDIYRNNDPVVDFTGGGNDDYEYFNYTCYLGGGWYGNIGLVMLHATNQDYACVGDPLADAALTDHKWRRPEVAKRRVYRGMLHKYSDDGTKHVEITEHDLDPTNPSTKTVFYSQGIRDAAVQPDPNWAERNYGHDFVISNTNSPTVEDCKAVMSLPDANPDADTETTSGVLTANLFHHTAGDFICLNEDGNNSPSGDWAKFLGYPWNYLNTFDTDVYDARTDCPYDPSVPPSKKYVFSGKLTSAGATLNGWTWGSTNQADGLFEGNINTSDGYNNCRITATSGTDVLFDCDYYVWSDIDLNELPWTGAVVVNTPDKLVCAPGVIADPVADHALFDNPSVYSGLNDQGASDTVGLVEFTCEPLTDFTIQGNITVDAGNDISAVPGGLQMSAYDANDALVAGSCSVDTASVTTDTLTGENSVPYSCTGLLEPDYTLGFTGRIELQVPADYSCDAVSANASCLTNDNADYVVRWSFSNYTTPNPSTGNDVLFDGPRDRYTISGNVIDADPADALELLAVDTTVSTTDGGCTGVQEGANVSYTCDVTTGSTTGDETWSGDVTITPKAGLWCGGGALYDANILNVSINADATMQDVTCVKDTTDKVRVYGSVYVPVPYLDTSAYEPASGGDYVQINYDPVAHNTGDYDYIEYENVGTDNGSFMQEFTSVSYGSGSYVDVPYEDVGWGNGDTIAYNFRKVPTNTGTHYKGQYYDYVGPNNGNYAATFIDCGAVGCGYFDKTTDPITGATIFKVKEDLMGQYTISSLTVGTGSYAIIPVFTTSGSPKDYVVSSEYEDFYTIPAGSGYRGNAVSRSSLGKLTYYKSVGAGNGDFEPVDPATYNEVGANLGDWNPLTSPYYESVGANNGDYIRLVEPRHEQVTAGTGDYSYVYHFSDLVSLSATMTDGGCTFESVPTIADETTGAGGSAPGWFNFTCETTGTVSHADSWSGSVTVTAGPADSREACKATGYSSSYNVAAGSATKTFTDAYWAVNAIGQCDGTVPLPLPTLP